MTNGWHMALHTSERRLEDHELGPVAKLHDEMRIGLSATPRPGSTHGAMVWVTTSPAGPPIFVHIVLGSENYYKEPASGQG